MWGQKDRREYPRVNKKERREHSRVLVRLETEVLSSNEFQVTGWTRDLSVKGVFILCPAKLPVGARCKCRLSLGNESESPVIEVSGWVVRCDGDGVAVQFTDAAVEAFTKLKTYFW